MTALALSPRAEVATRRSRAIVRRLPAMSRSLLGLIFVFAGLNGFLNFLPQPTPGSLPKGAMDFFVAMMQTGYMLQLIAGTQLLAGALLLANRYVPLALALLAPVLVNIIAFHAFLLPAGIVPGAVALALEIHLAVTYRAAYRSMLAARVALEAR